MINILRRHYARYTPEMVARICGCSKEDFLSVAEKFCANSGRERTACFVYAVGWTQHSVGVQIIRAATIVQLLLGNMGRPGGGIMAMRGHASIQGSTDVPTLYDLLPGYIMQPSALREPRQPGRLPRTGKCENRLWWTNSQVPGQPPEGVVRRRGNQGERFRLWLDSAH